MTEAEGQLQLPRHINLSIEHNPHAVNYETVEGHLASFYGAAGPDIGDEEKGRAIELGELWVIQWYPTTPVGFFSVAASSLEAALAHAVAAGARDDARRGDADDR